MTLVTNSHDTPEKQLELFESAGAQLPALVSNGRSTFSDPAAASNKTLPIHRWVPWIAGFSSDFVKEVLHSNLSSRGVVLDPFAGVGTTLVEAVLQGHDAIGFEINPYAALACRTKLSAHLTDVRMLHNAILGLQMFYHDKVSSDYTPASVPPQGFKTRAEFYSPQVLRKILIVLDFMHTLDDTSVQNIFKLAFASTMIRYSNYSYEPSLARRVSSGKAEILDFPVLETVVGKLHECEEDIIWARRCALDEQIRMQVIGDSFFQYKEHLPPDSVDLIITSPPYLNNYHYNRNTRPQLYWLGYAESPQDLKRLEEANFGKYWQTVREQKCLNLTFSLPGTDLEERLQALRMLHPEKKVYGGNGWANYAASYFNDCHTFVEGIHYVLKPGGKAMVVIGNSILQGILIPTDEYLGKIAESVGLELLTIDIPRATRVGSSIIQSSVRTVKAKDAHQLYESVVVLRKK
ncbi:MAG: site-specific DNA-methyltransferase [Ktedonobacteraceae bacterium]|nr:site-specific DNA-methyltransferase [Ktedonobacteraceae bacterium]